MFFNSICPLEVIFTRNRQKDPIHLYLTLFFSFPFLKINQLQFWQQQNTFWGQQNKIKNHQYSDCSISQENFFYIVLKIFISFCVIFSRNVNDHNKPLSQENNSLLQYGFFIFDSGCFWLIFWRNKQNIDKPSFHNQWLQ